MSTSELAFACATTMTSQQLVGLLTVIRLVLWTQSVSLHLNQLSLLHTNPGHKHHFSKEVNQPFLSFSFARNAAWDDAVGMLR